jgi:hypothetical protein
MEKEPKPKTNSQRIEDVFNLAGDHFGDVKFVGLKYDAKDGWLAKIRFKNDYMPSIMCSGDSADDAIKELKRKVKKAIARYNNI